jgi:dTDP-4-dehydrorhamnose reductase
MILNHKKVLITGANGTLGGAMHRFLISNNIEVFSWNREQVSVFNFQEMKNYILKIKPDSIFHFAMASTETGIENESWKINHDWSRDIAIIANDLNIQFVFSSTAMVFSDIKSGPFTKKSMPNASFGYGYEKLKAEESILSVNPKAYIIRLGWQIGEDYLGNNMLWHFENEQNTHKFVSASNKWFPACSFLKDTVIEMVRIINQEKPSLYMIDANDGFSFYKIAICLNKKHNNRWVIVQDDSYVFDQRMIDLDCKIPKLNDKF